MTLKHANDGHCAKCAQIFERFPGFHEPLRNWFETLQAAHPEAHISCAGRGKVEQELAVKRGASRARFGQSAHNYNIALDLFEMQGDRMNIYERPWFDKVIAPAITTDLKWYGAPGSTFPELPHVEIANWRQLRARGELKLVE